MMFGPSGEWFVVGISVPIGWSELVFRRMMIDQENWWSELCQWGEVFLGEYSPGFNAVCFFALLPPVVSAGVGRSSTGGSFRYEWRSSWPPRITRATAGAAAAWDYLGRPLATLPLAGRQSFGPRRHLLDRDAPKFALPGVCPRGRRPTGALPRGSVHRVALPTY